MANLYQVEEIPEGKSGKRNSTWQRYYNLAYRVWLDDSHAGPNDIRAATTTVLIGGTPHTVPLMPYIGLYYKATATDYDFGSFVTDEEYTFDEKVPNANNSGRVGCTWICKYQFGPYDGGAFGPDPCTWPIRLKFSGQPYQKIIFVDANGNPILNSARCPYQDPVQVDDSRSIITVTRNEPLIAYGGVAAFSPSAPGLYRDKVNNGIWNGFAAKTVKCTSIETGDEQYDSNNQRYYYEVTYQFEINEDTWQVVILDQGKQILDGSGEPTPLLTAEGQLIDEPVLLDGSGHELASGGTPQFGTYDGYVPVDFTAFNMNFALAIGRS